MSIFDKNAKEINGPINVIRMEGHVNNIKKVIYIFMDHHSPFHLQTECDNVFSKDINTYFAENFDKLNGSDKMYDFFLEIRPTDLQNISYGNMYATKANYRYIYIGEVLKLFRKIFDYDPKINKVNLSKYFKNVRLHYMDIRDYFEGNQYEALVEAGYLAYAMQSSQYINSGDLDRIISLITNFNSYCKVTLSVIESYKTFKTKKLKKINMIKFRNNNEQKTNVEEDAEFKKFAENIDYIMNKIFTKYNHQNVKKVLQKQLEIFEKYLVDLIAESNFLVNEYASILDILSSSTDKLIKTTSPYTNFAYGTSYDTQSKMIQFINGNTNSLLSFYVHYFARFMDYYFLRRFLDKDYITNAITYTGSAHSEVYIKILSKDFGFKITHVSYSKISNIDDLNKEILKMDISDMGEIFYPPIRSQCSDLTKFPENFS
jgi:hypothetical protein